MAIGTETYAKKILLIRFFLLITFIAVIFMSLSVFERFRIEREMNERRDVAEADYEALLLRKDDLGEKVDYLSKESSIESEIRKHFDVAKEGEQVVIILDDDPGSVITPLIAPPALPPTPWYIFWR